MAIKTALFRLLRSRLGLAVVVGLVALVVIGGYHWQLSRLEGHLEDAIAESAQHQANAARLQSALERQSEKVEQMAAEAERLRQERALAARDALADGREARESDAEVPAQAEEMNEWMRALW